MTILLVRPRLIGDVILTTPAVRAIRRRYPDARLLYLVEALAAPVIEANPHVDDVITLPYRRGWQRVKDDVVMALDLRSRRIDVAIDFHGGPRSGWLTWASRAPTRIGYDVAGRGWMYTRTVPRGPVATPRHSVLNQWDLLIALDRGFETLPTPDVDRVEMPVTASALCAIDRRLADAGLTAGQPLVIMHVSARNRFRRWPEASFAAVAAGLVRHDSVVVVMGGPSDRDAAERVIEAARQTAGRAAQRIVPGEGWSLAELRAVMERASMFIGGDSGPLHVAATSDVPIVALYGPTLPGVWAPWRPSHLAWTAVDAGPLPCRPCAQRECAPGDFRCLTNIAPSAVLNAAEHLLERAR
ncbi:MAG: glycosyltransferase family 9 protein [Acidobacteria bacterium]|nr:glycosyltransferase family 9 protein [Acidobacteriota bacterium]